jgi:hypothetical protein
VKTIVIFCPYVAADKYPFNDPYRWDSYQDLLLAIRARGAAAYFAADNATYRGQGVFATAYTTDRKCQVAEFEVARDVKAGLVFEKGAYQGQGGFAADDVQGVLSWEVNCACRHRASTGPISRKEAPRGFYWQTRFRRR